LCLRNDYDLWNLPGGGLENGEAPWQGVIREVKEETGLDVEITKLIGIYSKTDKNDIVFAFECKIIGGKITLNEEAKDIKWFSLNEIPKNFPPKQLERINDLFENKKEVIMKIQKGKGAIELIKERKL
jgi:ADP-ribose pyrophosphatase YjhB (NUDIX family)